MNHLSKYIRKFSALRTAKLDGSKAPHKPILLLSIIEGIQTKEIKGNRIYITPELVAQFKDYWHQLVHYQQFTPNFSLPFYHLKSDGFWHLKTVFGREFVLTSSHSIKSFAHLKEVVDYASLDEELYMLLSDNNTREVLRQALLNAYFPNRKLKSKSNELIATIINQILHEPASTYQQRIINIDEEEVFVRSGVFKKEIPKIYNYTCCISGMRVIVDREIQMVDACHIVPFSESHDDTISNGLSLCPNLHRAFDRGLISISNDYRVMVKSFHESDNGYSIKQFEGIKIHLPNKYDYFPSQNNLAKHRERFCFQ